jgi:hypothetical protein
MSGSSNGLTNGLIFATTVDISAEGSPAAGTFRVLSPVDLTEIYNSNARASDALGTLSKYSAPVDANGRVFISTGTDIKCYGLFPSGVFRGQGVLRGQGTQR